MRRIDPLVLDLKYSFAGLSGFRQWLS